MEALFSAVNTICGKIQIVSNWFWDFPTNLDWYASIPVLGNFSLAIILLVGTGIYFTFKLRFVQVRKFKYGLQVLINSKSTTMGISSLGAFLLSTAMRVGPGNILGVTGAISIGGPGALFWMWISAFFGMATAFVESTMSQIFKEKRGDAYVGGLPFYGRRLLKDAAWAGVALSVLYIIYAFLCFPAQGFNTISAVGAIAGVVTGTTFATNSALYWVSFAVLIVVTAIISFGGIKKVSKVTDVLVPIMAVVYVLTVVVLVLCNFTRIPWFFAAIFTQAFKPAAVFGGAFGIALSQGIKRGLMSGYHRYLHPDRFCGYYGKNVADRRGGRLVRTWKAGEVPGILWCTDRKQRSGLWLCDPAGKSLLWPVRLHLPDGLHVLYRNVCEPYFRQQGFHQCDPRPVPGGHQLRRYYEYCGYGSGSPLGSERFC